MCVRNMENEIDFLKKMILELLSARAPNDSDGYSISPDLGSSCYQ